MRANGLGQRIRQSARALVALTVVGLLFWASAAARVDAQGVPDPNSSASCGGGIAVPNPEANPALVRDCEALLDALPAIPDNAGLNWDANVPISDWKGVAASGSPSRIAELKIGYVEPPAQEIMGSDGVVEAVRVINVELIDGADDGAPPPLLPIIARLDNLRTLELIGLGVSGEIPSDLGELQNLETLNLSRNKLSGAIPPELGNLRNLATLDLSWNGLLGAIPPELGNLRNLETLDLSENHLSGAIPPEIGGISKLKALRLGYNGIHSAIPPELGGLSRLEELDLYQTDVDGTIPPELGNLASLKALDIWNTDISAPFPDEFRNLTNLKALKYNFNEHHFQNSQNAELPDWLTELTNLETLHVQSARGDISEIIRNLTNLREFYCGWCYFVGEIPPEIGNLSELTTFVLERTDISGPIPPEIGDLSKLEMFVVESPHGRHGYGPPSWSPPDPPKPGDSFFLSGELPKELGKLKNLKTLRIGWSMLEGRLPRQLGNLSQLEQLILTFNYIEGEIPAELGRLRNLWRLSLYPSKLSGCVPASLESGLRITDGPFCAPSPPPDALASQTPTAAFYAALAVLGAVFAVGALAMFAPRRRPRTRSPR